MHFKIYGELNTGTNFLARLLRQNTNLTSLDTKPAATIKADSKIIIEECLNHCPSQSRVHLRRFLAPLIHKRLVDKQRMNEFGSTLGWKHPK